MVLDHHCETGECLHCGVPDGAHPRARGLAAGDATGSGGSTPLRSTGPSDTIAIDDPNTTVALTTAAPGSPCAPLREEESMYLIVRVHRSNAWADTPDYAAITLTEDLCLMVISRITMVHNLTTQEGMGPLAQMAYWDAHARYLHASALLPSA